MMRIEILDGDTVVNTVIGSEEWAEQTHPGAWRLAEYQNPPQEPAAEPKRLVSVLAFRKRYTLQERAAIELAAVDRPEQSEQQRQQAAMVRATLADIAAASYIDLDDSDTIAGTEMLEAAGLIAPGRAEEILLAPVMPNELP